MGKTIYYKNIRDLGIFEIVIGTISFMASYLVIYETIKTKEWFLIFMFMFMFGYGILAIYGGYQNMKKLEIIRGMD